MWKWIQQALCEHKGFGVRAAGSYATRKHITYRRVCQGCGKMFETRKAK